MRRAIANLREAVASKSDAEVRKQGIDPLWVFPRDTMSGHIEGSTINEQHDIARRSAQLPEVVIYDFRHTRITRWAKVLPLPVVQRLAGHKSIATTMRYVHISDDDVRAAMAKEQEERSGHTSRHTDSDHSSVHGAKTL
jgi:integrase